MNHPSPSVLRPPLRTWQGELRRTAGDLSERAGHGVTDRGHQGLLGLLCRTADGMAHRGACERAREDVSLAVVVQRMVESRAAGVLFTHNPANGRRDRASISAAWGLGESVVGSSVTPDSIVVARRAGV